MTETGVAGRRRRGRERGAGADRSRLPDQRPFAQSRMRYQPTEVVSADELESIHQASLRILAEIGMNFLDQEARELLAAAGADVEPGAERVRFDPAMITERICTCPSEFLLHSWNPAHTLTIGGDHLAFGSVGSPPNIVGLDGVRRPGDREAFRDLLKLCQTFNCVHFIGGYPVEPIDLHWSVRHLEAALDVLTFTDKVPHSYSLGRQRNRDVLEMTRIARQVDEETLQREPSVFTVVNSSSPLRLDAPMLQGIIEFSSRNQVVVMTPFTLSGAMAPVTLAGAVAQQNAEALAGMAFTQVVRPGAPVIYGGFTSNVDMQSGAPAFGTPEYVRTAMLGGQLARRYAVPYRSSNVSAANALDAQAAYESVFSLWGAIMGGVNFLMHGAGWMEGGLHASAAKLVLDADLLGMVEAFLDPIVVDEDTLAVDAIREVGPGGHFFGVAHTQARFRTAFHRPMISDWRNYETWAEAGRPESAARAAQLAGAFLDAYEPPAMEAAVREELETFVARRVADGGVPTDF
ncbi:MAG: trimethylamine methyltransferase family protein [Acidimicrobiia bacterium]|nr:trimethylamine methyltransferase family protein [Acidimicrobiia bacterium]MDQ3391475.1 trimethylamine methyltransferase family protein [Actinomycetota bacterium]